MDMKNLSIQGLMPGGGEAEGEIPYKYIKDRKWKLSMRGRHSAKKENTGNWETQKSFKKEIVFNLGLEIWVRKF
jgi:hypothetical protein